MDTLSNLSISSKLSLSRHHRILLLMIVGYFSVALFLGVFLHYDFLRSDVLGYWQDSLAWQSPFHPFHVPGYPLMIALLQGLTFGVPSAISVMMAINLATFLASSYLTYRVIQMSVADDKLAILGMLLFGLWPFVGLTYTVNPLADMPAMFLFLSGSYLLLKARRLPAALLFGLSMITHKAMWLFVGLLLITEFLYRSERVWKRRILIVITTLLPLGALWLLGSFYHHSVMWLFSSNLEAEVLSRSTFPILDGLFGTIVKGDITGLVKGVLLTSFAAISIFATYMSLRLKYVSFQFGLAVSLAVLTLFLVLNQHEIWAAMRFSRMLVIPLILAANTNIPLRNLIWWKSPVAIAGLAILLVSQFAYAAYMAIIYFA